MQPNEIESFAFRWLKPSTIEIIIRDLTEYKRHAKGTLSASECQDVIDALDRVLTRQGA